MPEVLVRNLDSSVVEQLLDRAQRNGRSLEDEIRGILARAAIGDLAAARDSAERIRRRLQGRRHSDSAELVAEDRSR